MHKKLSPEELYSCCNVDLLKFETTAEIRPALGTIGQDRAMSAIDFGLNLESKGFNIFVLGESGTGRRTSIRQRIEKMAAEQAVPDDWCYVYNFKDPDTPWAISLPPGMATDFHKDMLELVHTLQVDIPKVFESKEYEKSKNKIMEDFQSSQKELFSKLEDEAKDEGFSIRKTVSGLLIVPVKQSGEPLTEEEFENLDDEHKQKIEAMGKRLQEKLDDVVRNIRAREKDIKTKLAALDREVALSAVGHLVEDLKDKYKGYDRIVTYLDDVQEDILEHVEDFKGGEEQASPLPFMRPQKAEPTFTRYEVNVLVNNKDCKGAPCVFESNPTYYNIFGRIEHKFQYGVAMTDFSMIKAGSLHRANGGYIVIEALDLLRNLFSYESLKRAIRNKEVKIEDVWEQYRLVSTTALKPDAIPLDIKVILIGNPYIYYLLYNLDEEYRELFKVKADFDWRMDKNEDTISRYVDFVASITQDENLVPFDRSGVARVVEHSARLSGHQDKLTSKFSGIADLIREAHYWARQDGRDVASSDHVEKAISQRVYRSNRIEDRMQEMMEEDTLIVRTSGEAVGQVNGLAVLGMGDYSFGKPARITCRTFAGRAGVLNIERETKMSGKIHEKAIMIISSYLGSKYAMKKPISLSASITFEQLYDMIEGDSATCAELYVLLSSLSGVPLRQDMAVTGSMDQNGEVQPIGGVNEKIEGFFDLCRTRGLDGNHGVIIPRRNLKNLMLKKDVVDAVSDGKFSIYPIDWMEEGLEILTGREAGKLRDDGTYPEGTINALVKGRLEEITESLKAKNEKEKGGEVIGHAHEKESKEPDKDKKGGPDKDGDDEPDKRGPDKGTPQ